MSSQFPILTTPIILKSLWGRHLPVWDPKFGIVVDSFFTFSHWNRHPIYQQILLAFISKATQNLLLSPGLLQNIQEFTQHLSLLSTYLLLRWHVVRLLKEVFIMSLKVLMFWPLLHLWPHLLPVFKVTTFSISILAPWLSSNIVLPKILFLHTFAWLTSIFFRSLIKCYLFGEAFLTTLFMW